MLRARMLLLLIEMSRPSCDLLKVFRVVMLAACATLASAQAALGASPIQQLTNSAAADIRPVWSPDGKRIAFQSNRAPTFQVYVMEADGANEQRISSGNYDDRHPSWSPDASQVAVDSGSDYQREIWTIDVGSGARRPVTQLGGIASFPSWSPDGARISFYWYQNGTVDLWLVNADGNNPRQLTQGLASEQKSQCTFACHAAPWSPDGSRVAYSTADQAQVWTLRASDGGDAVKISPAQDTGRSHFPTYLADGRLVYVTEHVTPGVAWTDVWTVLPSGSGQPQPLLEDVQAQGPFAFSSDGQWMAFSSPRGGNFDLYRVPLNQEGREAMKVRSADTEPSPALLARAASQGASPASVSAPGAGGTVLDQPALPYYLAALGGLAGLWLAVEGVLWQRRRSRRRLRR